MKLRVLHVVAALDEAARYLASSLANIGLDITIAAPRPGETDPAGVGMARRLTPLRAVAGDVAFSTTVYEGRLWGGRGSILVFEPDTDALDPVAATCHALVASMRANGRPPDVVHAGAGAELMFDLAATLQPRPALVYDTANVDDRAALLAQSTRCDHIVVPSRSAATEIRDGLECPVRGIMLGVARTRPGTLTKAGAKAALQRALGLPVRPRVPLVASLGPYDPDLLGPLTRDTLAAIDAQLVFRVIKNRDNNAPSLLGTLASRLPTKMAIRSISATEAEAAAHRMLRAADFQLFAHPYRLGAGSELVGVAHGAVPIAPHIAGFSDQLADFDAHTGSGAALLYPAGTAEAAIARAARLYTTPSMASLRSRVDSLDLTWSTCAVRYSEVYRDVLRRIAKK